MEFHFKTIIFNLYLSYIFENIDGRVDVLRSGPRGGDNFNETKIKGRIDRMGDEASVSEDILIYGNICTKLNPLLGKILYRNFSKDFVSLPNLIRFKGFPWHQ